MSVHYELTSVTILGGNFLLFFDGNIFDHLMQRNHSLEKTDAGKNWRQKEKGMTKNEIVEWHHQLNEHEFEQALGDGERQGSLVCFSPWSHIELDIAEWLNNKNLLINILAAADLTKKWRGGIERGQFKRHFKFMKKKKINSHTCI